MTELRTRQEELWWDAPRIRYMRERVIESVNRSTDWCEEGDDSFHNHIVFRGWKTMSPIPECVQFLVFVPAWGGWTQAPFYALHEGFFNLDKWWRWGPVGSVKTSDYHKPSDHGWYEHGGVDSDKLVDFITGPNDPTLTALDRMMYVAKDPRKLNPGDFNEGDDSRKAHWLLCTAIDRLLQDEPEIPSMWREDDRWMLGWDPLPAEDGRSTRRQEIDCPMLGATRWFGTWKHNIHEWRWRAARTDLRYDGVHPG
jgi:hypothetical protein